MSDVAAGLLAAYRAETLNHEIYHLGPGRNYDTAAVAAAVRAAVPGATIEVGQGTQPWTTYNTMRGPSAVRGSVRNWVRPPLHAQERHRAFAEWICARPETFQ